MVQKKEIAGTDEKSWKKKGEGRGLIKKFPIDAGKENNPGTILQAGSPGHRQWERGGVMPPGHKSMGGRAGEFTASFLLSNISWSKGGQHQGRHAKTGRPRNLRRATPRRGGDPRGERRGCKKDRPRNPQGRRRKKATVRNPSSAMWGRQVCQKTEPAREWD